MEHDSLSLDRQTAVGDYGGAFVRIASLLIATFLAYGLGLVVIEYQNPLTNVPGPWLARYSRLWLLKAILSRKFEKVNVDLHRRHGWYRNPWDLQFVDWQHRPYRSHWP